MADGLRTVGCCPRCGGVLIFADGAGDVTREGRLRADGPETAPHLVLGIPRR